MSTLTLTQCDPPLKIIGYTPDIYYFIEYMYALFVYFTQPLFGILFLNDYGSLFRQLKQSLFQDKISLENNDVQARIVVWTFLKSQHSFFFTTHLLDVCLLNIY